MGEQIMLLETRKVKILVKINELQKEKTELERKLREEKDFNIAAWKEYGSELCANSMIANEAVIAKKIADVAEKIHILEQYLTGAFSASGRTQLYKLTVATDEAIKELEAKRLKLQESLSKFVLLDALLIQSGVE